MSQIVGILPINKWIKENASKINIKIHKKRHSPHRLIEHPLRTMKGPSGRLCKHIDYYGCRHGSRKNLLSIRLLSQLTSFKIDFAMVTSGIGFAMWVRDDNFFSKSLSLKRLFFLFFFKKQRLMYKYICACLWICFGKVTKKFDSSLNANLTFARHTWGSMAVNKDSINNSDKRPASSKKGTHHTTKPFLRFIILI